jgi:hypothetical protein
MTMSYALRAPLMHSLDDLQRKNASLKSIDWEPFRGNVTL